MSLRLTLPLPLMAIALAACSNTEDAEPMPEPSPALTSQPVPTAAADGTALAPGSWSVSEDADGARAAFAEAGGQPLAVLSCDRARKVLKLTRTGAANEAQAFVLEVGDQRARVDMEPAADGSGLAAEVDGTLPLFAAMSDPAETIRLSAEGTPPLNLPAHAGIARVMESCR